MRTMLREIPALIIFLLPLTLSPGPANLLLAGAAASFGLRQALPFLLGLFTIFLGQGLLIGAGLGELMVRLPAVLVVFQMAGAVYLLYLARSFFRSRPVTAQEAGKMGLREGAVMQALNFKALIVHTLLFSQFLEPERDLWPQILFLLGVLVVIGLFSAFVWLLGGSGLGRLLRSERGARWQGRLFGVLLLLVALWMFGSALFDGI